MTNKVNCFLANFQEREPKRKYRQFKLTFMFTNTTTVPVTKEFSCQEALLLYPEINSNFQVCAETIQIQIQGSHIRTELI